jgi:predicted solute-binding protein
MSASYTFSLVTDLTEMRCTTSEGTTCSPIVISIDKKEVDTRRYVIMVMSVPSVTTSKVILFYVGISALQKERYSLYLNCSHTFKQ